MQTTRSPGASDASTGQATSVLSSSTVIGPPMVTLPALVTTYSYAMMSPASVK